VFWETNAIAGNFLDRANVRRVGSRLLHDVGIELGLPLPGVRLTLEAKNLGDDRTRDALGLPLPGRTRFATVSYRLGGREGDVSSRGVSLVSARVVMAGRGAMRMASRMAGVRSALPSA